MMKYPVFFLLLLLLSGLAKSQKLTATVDRNNILIGEQIKLKIEANFTAASSVGWPVIDSIPRFEILSKSAVDSSPLSGGVTLSQELVITSWDSGKLSIPSFIIGPAKTKPIAINVAYEPSPFDTTQPYHEIKEILEVKKPGSASWKWYLIFALVIIALFLLFFPKSKKKAAGFVPDANAYKAALQALEQLRNKTGRDGQAFYTELVQIFRTYLFKRRNIQSYSKTTDDLGIQMQQLQMDREQYAALLQSLRLSDSVKFARYRPTAAEEENSVQTIRNSIITIEQMPHVV